MAFLPFFLSSFFSNQQLIVVMEVTFFYCGWDPLVVCQGSTCLSSYNPCKQYFYTGSNDLFTPLLMMNELNLKGLSHHLGS